MGGEGKENAGKHLTDFAKSDHEILVRIVKECQRQDVEGRSGTWKQYIANHVDQKANPGPNDPAKRPWQVLAQFVESLTAEEDIKMVERMRKWQARKHKAEEQEQADPWALTPEQELVLRSQRHPNYKLNYNFPSYGKDWVCTKGRRASEPPSPSPLLGVDCEMCVCEGQVRELVRVAVVDRDFKVLLSSLVRPSRPVVDYKTPITGVGPTDLEGVTFTQADAQKAVKKLLTPATILVGHGLHHDLRALKIDHPRVIDTSLIFLYEGLSSAIPSLSDLCQAVLKEEFRQTGPVHDSVEDALTPMKLVLHEMEKGPSAPLKPPQQQVDKTELSKLFIHRIPRGTTPEDLVALFPPDPSLHVQMVTWKSASLGTTFAVFKNPEVANLAFKALQGTAGTDSLGRAQKTVPLELGGVAEGGGKRVEVVVRKMGCHNGQLFGVDARKGAVFSMAKGGEQKTGKEEKKGGKRAMVAPTGEDLIEGGWTPPVSSKKVKTERTDGGVYADAGGLGGGTGTMGEKSPKGGGDGRNQAPKRALDLDRGSGQELGAETKRAKKGGGEGSKKARREKRARNGAGEDGEQGNKEGQDGEAMEVDGLDSKKRRSSRIKADGRGQTRDAGQAGSDKRDGGGGQKAMRPKGAASIPGANEEGGDLPSTVPASPSTPVHIEGGAHGGPQAAPQASASAGSSGMKRGKSVLGKRWERPDLDEGGAQGKAGAEVTRHGSAPSGNGRGGGSAGGSSPREVEMLRRRLEEREAEVGALQRLVTELAKRQTLH